MTLVCPSCAHPALLHFLAGDVGCVMCPEHLCPASAFHRTTQAALSVLHEAEMHESLCDLPGGI